MKAFNIWWSIILCLVTFTNQLQAETNLQITYKYEYLKAFALTLQNLQNQTHSIRLIDANGVILIAEEVVAQTQFGRMYNLENLPGGNYELVVENDQEVVIQPLIIHRRFLTIDKAELKETLKPAIKVENDLIAINMLHFEKEAILITLETEEGQTVYSHSFRPNGSLNKQLNIRKLSAGQYSLTIQTARYEVKKRFIKGGVPVLIAGKI